MKVQKPNDNNIEQLTLVAALESLLHFLVAILLRGPGLSEEATTSESGEWVRVHRLDDGEKPASGLAGL